MSGQPAAWRRRAHGAHHWSYMDDPEDVALYTTGDRATRYEVQTLCVSPDYADDLLEALILAAEAIRATNHHHRSNLEEVALRAARSAIAKATGVDR